VVSFVTPDFLQNPEAARLRAVAAKFGTDIRLHVVPQLCRHLNAPECQVAWGWRLRALRDMAAALQPTDIILQVDASDVLIASSPAQLLEGYQAAVGGRRAVLYGAERQCWQDDTCPHELAARYPLSGTPYRFLNGGTVMGPADAIVELLDGALDWEHDDSWRQPGFHDQGLLHPLLVGGGKAAQLIALDTRCTLLCALFQREDDLVCTHGGWLNAFTGTRPLVLHASGPLRQWLWREVLPTFEALKPGKLHAFDCAVAGRGSGQETAEVSASDIHDEPANGGRGGSKTAAPLVQQATNPRSSSSSTSSSGGNGAAPKGQHSKAATEAAGAA
jgi:hypothetical protein